LPEAQLDRFLISLHLGYPERDQEVLILEREEHDEPQPRQTLTAEQVLGLQAEVRAVGVARAVKEYIVDLAAASRSHPDVVLGASSRAAVALQRASQAAAALEGRSFVLPDDVKLTAPAVMSHRLITRQGGSAAGRAVVRSLLAATPVPLAARRL
ncbi:MAG: MoxR family ATPase, partial [Chloroflexi bacterium]|nr:MoxR family ATPase [Chloroflexota bacterium]